MIARLAVTDRSPERTTHSPSGQSTQVPTVVFLGSLGASRSMWSAQQEALTGLARTIAVDLRGHGGSEILPGPCTIAELGEDVLAALAQLQGSQVQQFHLVGLSLGGAVTQWIARYHPERINSLTLVGTALVFGSPQNWIEKAADVRLRGTDFLAEAVVSRWFTSRWAQQHPDVVESYRQSIRDTDDEGYAACCEALAQWDFTEQATKITAPTVVVSGDQDGSTSPEVVAKLARAISGAELITVSPAAHLVNVERPEEVTAVVRAQCTRS